MTKFTLQDIEAAARVVYREFAATPQYRWALLSEKLGTTCWVKHENHTPVGAFKVRGGLTYFEHLRTTQRLPQEVISATRGNHGQSIAYAAARHGVACTIVVPRGNSIEKNTAMRALGAHLLEHGDDFQDAREHAQAIAIEADCPFQIRYEDGLNAYRKHVGLQFLAQCFCALTSEFTVLARLYAQGPVE